MGQGQLRVIIYINFVELENILLHAKFHGHRTISSVGKIFLKVFTINKHGGHLGHVTCTIYISFIFYFPRRLHIKFALIGQAVSEKMMYDNNGYIHVYSPWTGADNPLGSNSFH